MEKSLAKTVQVSIKNTKFPILIYQDREGFYVARNLVVDISTQARSFEDAVRRIKEATVDYFITFPEELEKLEDIDFESMTYRSIGLSEEDVKASKAIVRQ